MNRSFFSFIFQLLRVQSSDGTKRVEIAATASLTELYESIFQAFNYTDYGFGVFLGRGDSKEVKRNCGRIVCAQKILMRRYQFEKVMMQAMYCDEHFLSMLIGFRWTRNVP